MQVEISSLEKINYRPSEPAKKIIRKAKAEFPKKSMNSIIDEAVIKLKV
jgi:hypothetical protein